MTKLQMFYVLVLSYNSITFELQTHK
eukprot:COSAG02_NODE_8805_length_2437_cov_7.043199_1_plen_25_part_10